MLKLKFDSKLDFQNDAINAVINLFKGQLQKHFDYTLLSGKRIWGCSL